MAGIGLGSAQFGLPYGATNRVGRVSEDEVAKILQIASDRGVGLVDTACLYGEAEEVLGRAFPRPNPFRVVTKTPAFDGGPITPHHVGLARRSLERSLSRMRLDAVYGLLVHHAEDVFCEGGDALVAAMQGWREEGLVSKIGVSVYSGAEAVRIAERSDIDLVQLPLNILDQRSILDESLAQLSELGVEVHVRSVFLQGIIVESSERLPQYFMRFARELNKLDEAVDASGIGRLAFALAFARQAPFVDTAIVGVCSSAELSEVLDAWDLADTVAEDFSMLCSDNEDLLSPVRWPNSVQ